MDLVRLDETKEGRPLMHLLNQQTRTIPSVRVYSDPAIAGDVKKRFERDFPLTEQRTYRDDEWDLMEY